MEEKADTNDKRIKERKMEKKEKKKEKKETRTLCHNRILSGVKQDSVS